MTYSRPVVRPKHHVVLYDKADLVRDKANELLQGFYVVVEGHTRLEHNPNRGEIFMVMVLEKTQ